jgi:hypothetical protein
MKTAIPMQLESQFQHFKSFYEAKNIKRSLTLCFSLGQAIVCMHLPGKNKPHELVVSTIGMLILLLFNDSAVQTDGISVGKIVEALQIDEETARKNLQCLSTSKYRILIM